jgi:hypothetical protein
MDLAEVQEKDLSAARALPAQGKWHPGTISVAEPGTSSKGSSMIKAQVTLTGERHEGYTIYHNFMTDKANGGAPFTKKQLMGCGIDVSKPQPDEEVAQQLLGKDVFVQVRHEVIKELDETTQKYTKIKYYQDENGKDVPAKKAVAVAFSLYDPTGGEKKTSEAPAPAKAETAPAPAVEGTPAKPTPSWVKAKQGQGQAPKA